MTYPRDSRAIGLDVPLGASVPDEGADDLVGVVAVVGAGFVETLAAGVGGVSANHGSDFIVAVGEPSANNAKSNHQKPGNPASRPLVIQAIFFRNL
ncbi:MAG: hypothetical protein ACOVQM_01465 [Pirellula sp.]